MIASCCKIKLDYLRSLLESEVGSTHLNGTTERHFAVALTEVHVPHAQVGALNEDREVHLPRTFNVCSKKVWLLQLNQMQSPYATSVAASQGF